MSSARKNKNPVHRWAPLTAADGSAWIRVGDSLATTAVVQGGRAPPLAATARVRHSHPPPTIEREREEWRRGRINMRGGERGGEEIRMMSWKKDEVSQNSRQTFKRSILKNIFIFAYCCFLRGSHVKIDFCMQASQRVAYKVDFFRA
jgi:hypothetical protein